MESIDSEKYYTTNYNEYFLLLDKKYPPVTFKINKKTCKIIDNALIKGQKYISVYLDHINLSPLHKPFSHCEDTILTRAKDKFDQMYDEYDLLVQEIHEYENDSFKLLLIIDIWNKKQLRKKMEKKLKNLEQSVAYLNAYAKKLFTSSKRWRNYK